MKLKLDKQTAQSLSNLRGSSDFKQVMDWLDGHREKFLDECCTTEGITLHRAQGKVFVVDGLKEAYRAAPETMDKFNQER